MLRLWLLWSLVWTVLSGPIARPAPQTSGAGLEATSCPFPVPEGESIDCGYFVVPENRALPDSNMIRLPVAIIRAHTDRPAPDPIVFLNGGPGYGALDSVEYWLQSPLLANRDIILVDQRGTGNSQPSLACDEFRELDELNRMRRLSVDESVTLDIQAAQRCRDRLIQSGVDLQGYTTAANASDIAELRQALGYQNWNLYGWSYGSRLAQTVMRDHPEGLRSVVLDSALPPQAGWWEERPAATERAFRALFDGCAADAACKSAFPTLEQDFYDLVDRLNARPITVEVPNEETGVTEPQLIDGNDIVSGGFDALYDTELIPYLPLAISEINGGNTDVITGLAAGLAGDPEIARSGMWFSVECADEAPFNDPLRVRENAAAYPRWRDFVLQDSTRAVCLNWGVPASAAIENEPIQSDIPALVLHGANDPIHPPSWGSTAASTLSQSYFYELPGTGHGAGFDGCGQELVTRFLDNPSQAPDSSCVQAMRGPAFVTDLTRNRGVFPIALALQSRSLALVLPIGFYLLLFVIAVLGWPLGHLRSRRRQARIQPRVTSQRGVAGQPRVLRTTRALAALAAALNLAFVAILIYAIARVSENTPYLLLFGLPAVAAPLFFLPWVAAILGIGLVVCIVLAWPLWSVWGRAYYCLLALALFGFTVLVWQWQLI